MGKKRLLLAAAITMLVSSYCGAEVIKLKFANYFPPMHMNSVMMGKYCEELNALLKDKVELTQYTGSTLLAAPKIAAGVSTGIADIGLSNLSYTRGRFPVMEIMELPLGFPSAWVASHVANDFFEQYNPKDFEGYHMLMFSTCGINVIQTVGKPVKTLSDISGLKIRGTGRLGDIVKGLGGTPVPVETPDLYDSLKRGVIEGALLPLETLKGFKTGEVMKYVSASLKVGSAYCFYVMMNKQKWESLPADIQKVFTDFSKTFAERWATEWNKIDIAGKEYFTQQGGQILPIPDDESVKWIEAVKPVVDDYKKDLLSKGYSQSDIDGWFKFVNERAAHWIAQEKAQNVPTAYEY